MGGSDGDEMIDCLGVRDQLSHIYLALTLPLQWLPVWGFVEGTTSKCKKKKGNYMLVNMNSHWANLQLASAYIFQFGRQAWQMVLLSFPGALVWGIDLCFTSLLLIGANCNEPTGIHYHYTVSCTYIMYMLDSECSCSLQHVQAIGWFSLFFCKLA